MRNRANYKLELIFSVEQKLAADGELEGYYAERPYFPGRPPAPLYIEDDHLPFLRKGNVFSIFCDVLRV